MSFTTVLTQNYIKYVQRNKFPLSYKENPNPKLQIVDIACTQNSKGKLHKCLMLTDGIYYLKAILITTDSLLINSLQQFQIIEVLRWNIFSFKDSGNNYIMFRTYKILYSPYNLIGDTVLLHPSHSIDKNFKAPLYM